MRLDKFLSDMRFGTRSEMRKAVREGRVTVDGVRVKDPGSTVMPKSLVVLDGEPVTYRGFEYILMNKPAGVLSATEDPHQTTVLGLLGPGTRRDLAPAGRLDKDAEGLLLLTNDGALIHSLLSPSKHVPKVYYVRLSRPVTDGDVRTFAEGMSVPEDETAGNARGRAAFTAKPAELVPLNGPGERPDRADSGKEIRELSPNESLKAPDGGFYEASVEITEGHYHQVKRMFAAAGNQVLYLKRIAMGPLRLDEDLPPGKYRHLTEEEINGLRINGA